MPHQKRIQRALISVFYKDGLEPLIHLLQKQGVIIYSTGGTRSFIESLNIPVEAVEDLTSYPSILGGRVKTLHPKVFGGILGRSNEEADLAQLEQYEIPVFDLVVVDLYPFSETVSKGASYDEIIEKIDIGGVSLIRAAAKNYSDVLIVSSKDDYKDVFEILSENACTTDTSIRKSFASSAFMRTAAYDKAIYDWFDGTKTTPLRYGENPHQKGRFEGNLNEVFSQLHGKELSYNNLLDADAAIGLIQDIALPSCAVIKHNNACGLGISEDALDAWKKALAGDPVSAFGGVIIFNMPVNLATAEELNQLFFEMLIAPSFSDDALKLLQSKKNRIILQWHNKRFTGELTRTVLNGKLIQDRNNFQENLTDLKTVTHIQATLQQKEDALLAIRLVKHTKSNAIVIVKDKQLLSSGVGQTSRVDALHQAIDKAKRMGFSTQGAVMASDAFFPFPDCVQIAAEAGINVIVQPGGSLRDQDSIDASNQLGIAMMTTGIRHFKH